MNAALEFEALKARRAPVFRYGAFLLMAGVPGLTALFYILARRGDSSPSAAKATAMITDFSAAGFVGQTGQILSIALLLSVGVAASWTFGREFIDGAAPALFAIATPRSRVALAKIVVLLVWAAATLMATVLLSVAAAASLGLGPWGGEVWLAGLRVLVGGLLVVVLTIPFGLVASWRRGYLPGVVALLLIVVATQIATALGAGGWFPYAAPSLWLGMGGREAAANVSAGQLLSTVAVGAAATWACMAWWRRAEITG